MLHLNVILFNFCQVSIITTKINEEIIWKRSLYKTEPTPAVS